ncbi:MAG: hypothetical protein JNK04_21705 [Myxococcales bacterium]|nr:hypothetical protein [Myxococcales bacterium]
MKRIGIGIAIALFGIAVPLTAMAGRGPQGTSVNGTTMQGTSVNGSSMQGTSVNGSTLQGTSVNGIIVGNGRAMGAEGATGLKVEGVRVEGGRLVR